MVAPLTVQPRVGDQPDRWRLRRGGGAGRVPAVHLTATDVDWGRAVAPLPGTTSGLPLLSLAPEPLCVAGRPGAARREGSAPARPPRRLGLTDGQANWTSED